MYDLLHVPNTPVLCVGFYFINVGVFDLQEENVTNVLRSCQKKVTVVSVVYSDTFI